MYATAATSRNAKYPLSADSRALQGSREALLRRPGPTIEVKLPAITLSNEEPGPCLIRTEPDRDSTCTFEAVVR